MKMNDQCFTKHLAPSILLLFSFLVTFQCFSRSFLLPPEPLRVTLSPKNLKTGISSTVILSCAVQGSPHFTVSWYRNTEPVLPDQHFSIQGAHNETLFISAAQKRHSGAYQCFATRKGQTAQDFSIILLEGEGLLHQGRFVIQTSVF